MKTMTKTEKPYRKDSIKLKIVLCCIFSFLCSILLVVGRTVYRTNSLHTLWDTPGRLAATLVAILGVAAAAAAISALVMVARGSRTPFFPLMIPAAVR